MPTLVSQDVWVTYGQFYVASGPGMHGLLEECFAGQRNGLCGAAVPGFLFLITGLHTGEVGLTVELRRPHEYRDRCLAQLPRTVSLARRPGAFQPGAGAVVLALSPRRWMS